MNTELIKLPAYMLSKMLEEKKVTSVQIIEAFLNQAEKHKSLNAYITLTKDYAIQKAKEADARIKDGKQKSKLDGIPIAIKDNFLTKGIKTTNASFFYKNFIPPYESTITQKLQDSGVICIGKTNMDEFAMGSDNTTSYFGPVINPWRGNTDTDKVPGGSSGGSAAAVAAKTAPLALGTDTGGSIRQPAAFCGNVGLKPTYGICSRFGIFAFASSLDQAGPISGNVIDNAMLLELIAGFDNNDTTMQPKTLKYDYTSNITNKVKDVTVGIIKENDDFSISEGVRACYDNTIKLLKSLGYNIKTISFPRAKYVLSVYYIIAPVEAMSNFSRYDGVRYGERESGNNLFDIYRNSRSTGFGKEVKSRILMGTYNVLKENFQTYINACKVRSLIAEDFKNMLSEVDFILTPTTSTTAFDLGKRNSYTDLEMYYNDIFTVGANLSGVPAISLPAGISSEGLPIGMQFIGNYYSEAALYNFAYNLEQNFNFNILPNLLKD